MFNYRWMLMAMFALRGASGCGDDTGGGDESSSAGPDSAGPQMCLENPDLTIDGQAIPITGFDFLNAFDPSDTTVYDPAEASELPGPLMVDTWGDRSSGPHGTLGGPLTPPEPPHGRNSLSAYNGVVLRGEMTNPFGTDLEVFIDEDETNDEDAVIVGPGSHWHVPAGSQHTTTCVGPEVCWFYFHAEAPFDFTPIVDETGALRDGVTLEAPHPEAVLLPRADLQFAGEPGSFVQFAPAWGSMPDDAHGTFGRFDAGATSPVHIHSEAYHAVVVSGVLTNPFNLDDSPPQLATGGWWSVPAESVHDTACEGAQDCLFYFHARAGFDFTPVCE